MRKWTAFTLAELVVIVAIIAIMSTVGYNALVNYYKTSILNGQLFTTTAILQRTRQRAISNSTSSDYSVKFLSDRYVVFPGTGYSPSNSQNISYFLDTGVILSTTFTNDELTFINFTGRTGISGSVTISAYGENKQIVINALGIVEDII